MPEMQDMPYDSVAIAGLVRSAKNFVFFAPSRLCVGCL